MSFPPNGWRHLGLASVSRTGLVPPAVPSVRQSSVPLVKNTVGPTWRKFEGIPETLPVLQSGSGVMPLVWLTDFAGAMTRSLSDLADMLNIIAGSDPED